MRKGYLIISIASLVIGLATLIVIASILYFPSGGRGIDVQEDEIIVRTGILAQTSDSYNVWRREIESGQLSLADYVRISLTGSDYLLQDRTDKVFANDLAYIAYGTVEQSEEILTNLTKVAEIRYREGLRESIQTDCRAFLTRRVRDRFMAENPFRTKRLCFRSA